MIHTLILDSDFPFALPFILFIGAFTLFFIATMWMIYRKAGYEGWECIIPIYGAIILLRIVGKPWWWLLLMLIPGFNIIWAIWQTNMLSKSFGKDVGFTLGLIFLGFIFYPILAFGKAQYQGPYGDPAAFNAYRASKETFEFEHRA